MSVRRAGFRGWTAVATLLVVAATGVVGGASSAAAATGTPISGATSHRCLGVRGSGPSVSLVQIWDCTGAANQAWQTTATGELRLFDGASCLDAVAHGTQPGTQVQIYSCHGGANQQWRRSGGTIVGVESGLCLDLRGGATANGTAAVLNPCDGRATQQWSGSGGDTSPPTVPPNPRVSNLTCTSVDFAWDAATDNVGVAYYDVYHDGQLMTSVSGATRSTTLSVVAGSTWGLYVNARDAAGNVSQASTTVTITPPACQPDNQPPTAPTGLTLSVDGTSVTLRWNAATDNVGVAAYDVYRNGTEVATVKNALTVTDSGLAPNTAYTYSVVARDAQNNASAPSDPVTVTTGAACANPVCGVTQVTTEQDLPWGLLTLPDGTVLYTRRDLFDIVHLDPATGTKTSIGTVPGVAGTDGEGGVLGIEIAPTFATDHWLYIFHTTTTDNRIVRIQLDDRDQLVPSTEQVLLTGILRNKYHNGGRLRFGPDGKLYASTGDAQNGDNAQKIDGLNGKVLRINPDGSVPADNPFGNAVWSYGHRNPQGLAFDAEGRLWEQEFGNDTMDETNLIVRGGNYGWPACEGTVGTCDTAGYIAPKMTYPVAQGSCSGIAIVRDALYIACERGTRMYRSVISNGALTDQQQYFVGTYGRLRTIEPAPGNALWLTTTNAGDKDSVPNNSNERILRVALGG
jgi:glucose/arabinose dehydrogenase